MKKPFRSLFSLALSAGLLGYVLTGISLQEIRLAFSRAEWSGMGWMALCILLSYVFRAVRWRLMLEPLGHRPPVWRTGAALMAGSFASMILPGLGEITRCTTLQRAGGVPFAKALGTVATERLCELAALLMVTGIFFSLETRRFRDYVAGLHRPDDRSLFLITMIGLPALALVLFGYKRFRKTRSFSGRHLFVQNTIKFQAGLRSGLTSILKLEHPSAFWLLTALIWWLYLLINYAVFAALPMTRLLPLKAALAVLVISALGGIAVPTQAGLGTYHFLTAYALQQYGLPAAESIVAATFMHSVQLAVHVFLSGISFLVVSLLHGRVPVSTGQTLPTENG
ncbi:lysylphosphatidylglycerol synthase transmembrane domain-containing protein [Larkinella soli]|uniref:lysylphosphatidylglycerol synthase transmembrane domain-containing protein n=1 Tax=Larkinella soli TaxID=1770527 RepID=UPI000FFB8735|nr:lysylphosphatidylglycerol synthase transmembrane domain-containing protein [Larkinella soli]